MTTDELLDAYRDWAVEQEKMWNRHIIIEITGDETTVHLADMSTVRYPGPSEIVACGSRSVGEILREGLRREPNDRA